MVRRLLRAGNRCIVDDLHPETVQPLVHAGAAEGQSLEDCVSMMDKTCEVHLRISERAHA